MIENTDSGTKDLLGSVQFGWLDIISQAASGKFFTSVCLSYFIYKMGSLTVATSQEYLRGLS